MRKSKCEMRNGAVSRVMLAGLLGVWAAVSADAWTPRTQQMLVSTAMHLISKSGVVELTKLEKDVMAGSALTQEQLARLVPALSNGPSRAVESEIQLLDVARGNSVDPYFAYRMGALGALVAQICAPLPDAPAAYRDRYYADIEAHFQDVKLEPTPFQTVDPTPYFQHVRRLTDVRGDMILREYKEGIGFAGSAKGALSDDVSRTASAIEDVWYTILTSNAVRADVSETQLREYFLGAFGYYAELKNEARIDATYQQLAAVTSKTPEMSLRIGDIFYSAGQFERAIAEYRELLAAEPEHREVREKIADYYIEVGDGEAKANRLEKAYEAYAKAAEADPTHPDAEAKRLGTQRQIADRDTRLAAARKDLEDGERLETQAEQFAIQHKHAEAITALRQAQDTYQRIPEEFRAEFQTANAALAKIAYSLRDMKDGLIKNSQSLSGSGFVPDIRRFAGGGAMKKADEEALRALATQQLEQEIERLKTQYEESLAQE